MAKVRYMGPASVFNDQPVPADGLDVTISEAAQLEMEVHGHRFEPSIREKTKPTPAAVNVAVNPETGESDLAKAAKVSAKETEKP